MRATRIRTGGAALLLALAACGSKRAAVAANEAAVANAATTTVEDASPDSLSAPDNMALDGESNDGDDGNAQ